MQPVLNEKRGALNLITLNRPAHRNAVNPETAQALHDAFMQGEADNDVRVHILTGTGGQFCAGADLKAFVGGEHFASTAPLGASWLELTKPSIAAVEGYAVAGGLELALLCDLRIAARSAIFGVFCRRWGVPLIDGGTIRLPRLIGQSRALDMILTGRAVDAEEALSFGLANRLVDDGQALTASLALAEQLARFPQVCLRNDRASAIAQWSLSMRDALLYENQVGRRSLADGAASGAARFVDGRGRKGDFDNL